MTTNYAVTVADIHSGVQKGMLDLNPLAVFVPCDNHSLNLVGVHTAHVNVLAVSLLGTVERLFFFFLFHSYMECS